ncbi:MAG TPA: shikimate dehydrogenase [Acidobacteriaceae bacterium]|jgi:3-dehydroquinate dehydratase/shikimate dehydrogenase
MTSTTPAIAAHQLRARMSRICVSVTGATAHEMLSHAERISIDNPFVELRLDTLNKPQAILPKLKAFTAGNRHVTVIATCRRNENGGNFVGELFEQAEILEAAAKAGCQLIDVEIESAEAMRPADWKRLRTSGAALVLSYHDFSHTRSLEKAFERMQRFDPEFYKIVPTARSLADNIAVLDLLKQHGDSSNMIAIAMGQPGVVSRLLAARAGGAFTFASMAAGEETAPGQMTLDTLRSLYRFEDIDAATRVYGVTGHPIAHSLSPLMLNTAFRRERINAVFVPLETAKISDLLALVGRVPLAGLAVTMPLKQEILPSLARMDELSTRIGACNTVVRGPDGRLFGFNTDVSAIIGPLERRLSLKGARVLVLGAGGAARAAVFGLKDKGAEVHILNRTPESAKELATHAKAKLFKREQLTKTDFDIVVNATPAGMQGGKVESLLEPEELRARLVFDMVYNPIETPLLRMAHDKGIAVIPGLEMFVHQGARQFEIWTGKPAPEADMRRVVIHALQQQALQPAKTA